MPKGVKGYIKGHKHSKDTIEKIRNKLSQRIIIMCNMCGNNLSRPPSSIKINKRHFCNMKCRADFVKKYNPIEYRLHNKRIISDEERLKRRKAREKLNHYLRDKKISRPTCEFCQKKAHAHHDDYDKPLDVRWLCVKHHFEHHKKITHENKDLL